MALRRGPSRPVGDSGCAAPHRVERERSRFLCEVQDAAQVAHDFVQERVARVASNHLIKECLNFFCGQLVRRQVAHLRDQVFADHAFRRRDGVRSPSRLAQSNVLEGDLFEGYGHSGRSCARTLVGGWESCREIAARRAEVHGEQPPCGIDR